MENNNLQKLGDFSVLVGEFMRATQEYGNHAGDDLLEPVKYLEREMARMKLVEAFTLELLAAG